MNHLPPDARDIELAVECVAYFDGDDEYQIRVWSFDRAPHHLQRLSTAGGDEDWLIYVPPKAVKDDTPLYWIENLDSGHKPQVINLPSGAQIYIVSH